MPVHFAVSLPNFDPYDDPRLVASFAREAEEAGWDGLFVWDHLLVDRSWEIRIADPFVLLTVAALATERIRLGTMVTPVPRRRPQVLARQVATLDRLSHGRMILGVGIGEPPDEFSAFGEDPAPRVRGERLDESLDVLVGLWSGERFSYRGRHLLVDDVRYLPTPVQRPRVPIWVAGQWPGEAPFRRAARWDGVYPIPRLGEGSWDAVLSPDDVRAIVELVRRHRTDPNPFEVMVGQWTPGDDPKAAAAIVEPYVHAGATWWSEDISGYRASLDALRDRVRMGPPRLDAPRSGKGLTFE